MIEKADTFSSAMNKQNHTGSLYYPTLKSLFRRLIALFILLTFSSSLIADDISDTNKYAWSSNAGWFNFKSTHQQVTVYDDHLEGYLWAENVGWIRLGSHTGGGTFSYSNNANTTYGVNNDGSGNLSGYAWSPSIGWINFNPKDAQVTIDANNGDFDGYAWSENIGWIHFKNSTAGYKVTRVLNSPAAFSFIDQSNVFPHTLITSNSIKVSDINSNATISISNGEYEINGNGNWLSSNNTVAVNDTVKVRHTSSVSYSTITNTVLTIGAESDTFSSSTLAAPAPTPTKEPEPDPVPEPEIDPPAIDLSTPEAGEDSVLEQLQKTSEITGEDQILSLTQNPETNNLELALGKHSFEFKPVQVTQAPKGTEAGIYLSKDGTVELVTESGQLVTLQAEPKRLKEMVRTLKKLGIEITRGAYGAIRFTLDSQQRTTTSIWFSARAAINSSPVTDSEETRTGMISLPSSQLKNSAILAQQFYEDEVLYRQYLYPAPADWDSLKNTLNLVFDSINIDLEGYISLPLADKTYKALMDYSVISGDTNSRGELYFDTPGDKNNDGIIDYEVIYENGERQIIFILP